MSNDSAQNPDYAASFARQAMSGNQGQPVTPLERRTLNPSVKVALTTILPTVVIFLGVVAFLAFLVAVAQVTSIRATLIAAVLALQALVLFTPACLAIDRWNPKPARLTALALIWGVGVVPLTTLPIQALIDTDSIVTTTYGFLTSTPVLVEVMKALPLLLMAALFRNDLTGPLSGTSLGALLGTGYACGELVFYFAQEQSQGMKALVALLATRGLVTPLVHATLTAVVGFAVGTGARRMGMAGVVGLWCLGLIPAVVAHVLWTMAARYMSQHHVLFLVLLIPALTISVTAVLALKRREDRLAAERLAEYAQLRWFAPSEVEDFSTPAGRRRLMSWATQAPGRAWPVHRVIQDALRLAGIRERMLKRGWSAQDEEAESRLLGAIEQNRAAVA